MRDADTTQHTPLQKFFAEHKELKISEFAKIIGIDATLMRNYINGFKKPSKERTQEILAGIHNLAKEYKEIAF